MRAIRSFDVTTLGIADLEHQLELIVGESARTTVAAVQDPLALLLEDLCTANLSSIGARLVSAEMLRLLAVRAELGDLEGVAAFSGEVVVLTGLPRTGSSFLHALFALDPHNHHLTLATALSPTSSSAQATAFATRYLAMVDRLAPRLRRLHPMSPGGPEECVTAMQSSFMSERFLVGFDLPGYGRWLDRGSMQDTYDWYSRLLGLTFSHSDCVVLKAPAHLARLDAVRNAFPRAKFVVLSRDQVTAIDSFIELVGAARGVYSDAVDAARVRREWAPRLSAAVDSTPDWAVEETDRVRHVSFDALTEDPERTLLGLYEWLGWVPFLSDVSRRRSIAGLAAYHRRSL